MVQVTKDEYENLIRDQHTVELLTGYAQKQGWMADSMLCLLLGIPVRRRWFSNPHREHIGYSPR